MKQQLKTAILMTVVTTVLLGIVYPLAVTGLAQLLFHEQANGSLLRRDGNVIGSKLLGQPFTGDAYFHSRPSAAGSGYDAANSGASNLGPTNHVLIERVAGDVKALQAKDSAPVPVDLVTTSGSGLDPDISPAAAEYQIARVTAARPGARRDEIAALVRLHTSPRQLGLLGEPRVNVLELNLELDRLFPLAH